MTTQGCKNLHFEYTTISSAQLELKGGSWGHMPIGTTISFAILFKLALLPYDERELAARHMEWWEPISDSALYFDTEGEDVQEYEKKQHHKRYHLRIVCFDGTEE